MDRPTFGVRDFDMTEPRQDGCTFFTHRRTIVKAGIHPRY